MTSTTSNHPSSVASDENVRAQAKPDSGHGFADTSRDLGCGNLRIGEPVVRDRLALAPVFLDEEEPIGPSCLTLDEALAKEQLFITEVNESGSVPFVQVRNLGDSHILILEGEEIAGAKQNRVFNVTILLAPGMQVNAPVSCTEEGRWGCRRRGNRVFAEDLGEEDELTSDEPDPDDFSFDSSFRMMPATLRACKTGSVTEFSRASGSYHSDQGKVWDCVSSSLSGLQACSPTSAMSDGYEARKKELEEGLRAFPHQSRQVGMVAFLDGRPISADLVSRPETYEQLHSKLVEGQLMSVLLAPKAKPAPEALPTSVDSWEFLKQSLGGERTVRPSVGLGEDVRHSSKDLLVASLRHEGATMHLGVYLSDERKDDPGKMTMERVLEEMNRTTGRSPGELSPEQVSERFRAVVERLLADESNESGIDEEIYRAILERLRSSELPSPASSDED